MLAMINTTVYIRINCIVYFSIFSRRKFKNSATGVNSETRIIKDIML